MYPKHKTEVFAKARKTRKKSYRMLRTVYKDIETDILMIMYDAVNDELIEREQNEKPSHRLR